MSEVDVAFRRAQAALRRHEYRLTAEEWARDVRHRAGCPGALNCDDSAHWYVRAIFEGRVFVDGRRVEADSPSSSG